MAVAFCNQTKFIIFIHLLNYFLLLSQPNSLFFAFIPRKGSEWAQCYSRDEKASSSSNSMVQPNIKVHKIFSQPRNIWEIDSCFDVVLSFFVTNQIMAAKQTRFVIHSSKERAERYISGPVELRRF